MDKRGYKIPYQIKPHFMKFKVVDGGATTKFWEYGNHLEEIFSKKFFWTKLSGIEKCFVYKNYLYLNH